MQNCLSKRMGLCLTLERYCTSCDWRHSFETSRPVSKLSKSSVGNDSHEINVLSVTVFRELDEEYETIKHYQNLMNHQLPSITYNDKINKTLYNTYETVAQQVNYYK